MIIALIAAYAVIPLSAESVNRMTKRSGLSLHQLLTDQNLALAPDSATTGEQNGGDQVSLSSNADETDESSQDMSYTRQYYFDIFSNNPLSFNGIASLVWKFRPNFRLLHLF